MINKSLTIIGLTGLSNAGKSLINNHLKKKGFLVFSLGNYIRQELDSRNLEHTYENMRCVSIEYAPMENTTLVNRFIKDIQNTNIENELIVLDGIKKISEVKCLTKDFKVVIVAILASRQTRYKRFNKRGRPDDVLYKNFLKRDEEEIQYGIGEVITLSDYFLVNEGTKEEAKSIFDSILLNICERPPLKTRTLDNYCI